MDINEERKGRKSQRDQLQQVVWDNEKILEDRVFAMATGSLAISLTIFQLQDSWNIVGKIMISSSWIILIISLILIIYSLYRARNKAEETIMMTYDEEQPLDKVNHKINTDNRGTVKLNRWSYYLTFLGIFLTASAAFITIYFN